jgi:hypothetical protein
MYGPPGKLEYPARVISTHYNNLQVRERHIWPGRVPLKRKPAISNSLALQIFIGDGAKLVRGAFELAKEKALAIMFIDELDAIGTKRFDSEKSGDREVQSYVGTPQPAGRIRQ